MLLSAACCPKDDLREMARRRGIYQKWGVRGYWQISTNMMESTWRRLHYMSIGSHYRRFLFHRSMDEACQTKANAAFTHTARLPHSHCSAPTFTLLSSHIHTAEL